MIWIEKDYVTGGWYIWFGKRGEKYAPDGTKWLSRAVPGQSIGYSLNLLIWLKWLQLLCYWTLPFWILAAVFVSGMMIGKWM